jgi:hypothetical protein
MKDIYELLRQKERELSRLEIEVEALRVVAPLLSNENEVSADNKPSSARSTAPSQPHLRSPSTLLSREEDGAQGWP